MTSLSGTNLNNGAAVGPQGEGRESPGSFPTYPTYRSSGIEWLGVVPEHWALGSLKHLAWIRNGRDYKDVESPDGEYPVIGSGGQFANATQYLYDGESVLLGRKGTIDKPLYIHGRFWTVDTMFYTEVGSGASAKFLYYNALTIPFQYYSTSTALPSMTQGDLLNHPCVIPALEEQTQIARFLDHETARIDALIEEQQRLIELLKEKRQAVISHAVTKGLDPTVPMKDSGVEWLGEVPRHWRVCKLSFRYSVELGKMLDEKKNTGTNPLPYLRNQDVQWGSINIDGLPLIDIEPSEYERYTVKLGDLLVCEGGDVGRAAIWRHKGNRIGYQKALHRLRPESPSRDTAEFFFFSLMAAKALGVFEESDTKATISHLPAEKFRQYRFAFPPIEDQQEIASVLGEKLKRSSETISYAENTITLLQERRSALISAAVTGKIDVRGWQPPASEPTPELVEEAV